MDKKTKCATKIQACWRGCNLRKPMLEPCDINEIGIDVSELRKYLIKNYLTPNRIEYYKSTSTQNLILEDGYMEFLTSKFIGGKRIGEGNCSIDVVKDDKGIDAFCVCMNNSLSNEKSIMQGLECGKNLDELFNTKKYEEAQLIYRDIYYKKLLEAQKIIKAMYYIGYISTNKNVYMLAFKLNPMCILNMKYDGITRQQKSIYVKGFIDDKLGATKLYQSKKRLELRLKKSILDSCNIIKII